MKCVKMDAQNAVKRKKTRFGFCTIFNILGYFSVTMEHPGNIVYKFNRDLDYTPGGIDYR